MNPPTDFRLLSSDEYINCGEPLRSVEEYDPATNTWLFGFACYDKDKIYRTRLSRSELAAARGMTKTEPEQDIYDAVREYREANPDSFGGEDFPTQPQGGDVQIPADKPWVNPQGPALTSAADVPSEGGAICCECSWVNSSLLNLGNFSSPRMVCHGCCKRAIEQRDALAEQVRTLTDERIALLSKCAAQENYLATITQLQRELEETKSTTETRGDMLYNYQEQARAANATLSSMQSKLATLQSDKERLDWLRSNWPQYVAIADKAIDAARTILIAGSAGGTRIVG